MPFHIYDTVVLCECIYDVVHSITIYLSYMLKHTIKIRKAVLYFLMHFIRVSLNFLPQAGKVRASHGNERAARKFMINSCDYFPQIIPLMKIFTFL